LVLSFLIGTLTPPGVGVIAALLTLVSRHRELNISARQGLGGSSGHGWSGWSGRPGSRRRANGSTDPSHVARGVTEQVGAPYPDILPAETTQLLDPQPVTISSARHRGIPESVGLDGNQDPTPMLRILDGEVQALTRCTVARVHHQTLRPKP
jgi:hypothetical protein